MLANRSLRRLVGADQAGLLIHNFRALHSGRESGLLEQALEALFSEGPVSREAHFFSSFGKEQGEQRLRDSEARFRMLFERAVNAIFCWRGAALRPAPSWS